MYVSLHQNIAEADSNDGVNPDFDDALIEKIWHNLDRQLPRERVSCVVAEVALGFQNATVKTYLPILVHRRALERLRQELNEIVSNDDHFLEEQK